MIIRFALTGGLLGVLVYALSQRNAGRVFHRSMVALAVVAIYFVWRPDHATALAHGLGVGRGTDLVLYGWVILSLLVSVSLHLRLRRQEMLLTDLARQRALAEARDEPDPQ